MLLMFPLLAISLVVYNVIVLGGSFGDTAGIEVLNSTVLSIHMVSKEVWHVTGSDVFLLVSLGFLFIELLRATRTHSGSIINHAFSMVVFIVALLQFVLMKGFGNSTFFLFMMMTLLERRRG